MWRSVLLHEFDEGDISAQRAVAGEVSVASLGVNHNAMAPGQEFRFDLATPVEDVIGVSCRMAIRYPLSADMAPVRVMRAGTSVELMIQQLGPIPGDPELSGRFKMTLRVGSTTVPLGNLRLPYRTHARVRVDWRTSGEASLWQDRQLVGYHNAVVPGERFAISNVTFGPSDRPLGSIGPRMGFERFFLRALTRTDALRVLDQLLPDLPVSEDPILARCRRLATQDLLATMDALRPFMAAIHQSLSVPWNVESGDPAGPFQQAAVDAHRDAVQAGAALAMMLRRQDFSAPGEFLEPFERLLRRLHDALPTEFEQLGSTLLTQQSSLDDCRDALREDFEEHGAQMLPVVELINAASEVLQTVVEGN